MVCKYLQYNLSSRRFLANVAVRCVQGGCTSVRVLKCNDYAASVQWEGVFSGVLRNCVVVIYLVTILSFFICMEFFYRVFSVQPFIVLCRIAMLASIECSVCWLSKRCFA
jgi:hypothetical protein